ncbi:MAG: ABC transporter substrate-binding protein [Patulibacter minatonensis]
MGQPARPGTRLQRSRRRTLAAAAAFGLTAAAALAVVGCGGGDDDAGTATATPTTAASSPAEVVRRTLVLDYQPNAVHAGIAEALEAGDFKAKGLDLKVVAPSSTSDALTQVGRGRADYGLADLIDVARRNDRALKDPAARTDAKLFAGRGGVRIVGAVVQQPLSGILVNAKSAITKPEQLAGKRIAVTGLPSDVAVVDAIARKDGKPVKTDQITLGFDGLKALHAGRVDAATAYWPADAVTLEQLGTPARRFTLSDAGLEYPGLVAFVKPGSRAEAQGAAFGEALTAGTDAVVADPSKGESALAARYPELDAKVTAAQLANYVPLFGAAGAAGTVTDEALNRFAEFAAETKLTSRKLTADELRGAIPRS